MAELAVGDIIKGITDDMKLLVRDEVELAKSELVPTARKAGMGAGLFGAAGFFAISGVGILYFAAVYGLVALGLSEWLAFLIVGVALLLVAAIAGGIGFVIVRKVRGPERTIAWPIRLSPRSSRPRSTRWPPRTRLRSRARSSIGGRSAELTSEPLPHDPERVGVDRQHRVDTAIGHMSRSVDHTKVVVAPDSTVRIGNRPARISPHPAASRLVLAAGTMISWTGRPDHRGGGAARDQPFAGALAEKPLHAMIFGMILIRSTARRGCRSCR